VQKVFPLYRKRDLLFGKQVVRDALKRRIEWNIDGLDCLIGKEAKDRFFLGLEVE
jgi:hypothetical protein